MTHETFNEKITFIRNVSLDVLLRRNARYSQSDDALHNFIRGAAFTNSTPAKAAFGYMTKHLVALADKIQNNDFSDMDDLVEKCTDIINYTAIIFAIGCEENAKYNWTHDACAAEQAPLFSVPPRFFEEDNE